MATHFTRDYYVITPRGACYPPIWTWEIRRKSKPLGITISSGGLQSHKDAQDGGKRAPQTLQDLAQEDARLRLEAGAKQ